MRGAGTPSHTRAEDLQPIEAQATGPPPPAQRAADELARAGPRAQSQPLREPALDPGARASFMDGIWMLVQLPSAPVQASDAPVRHVSQRTQRPPGSHTSVIRLPVTDRLLRKKGRPHAVTSVSHSAKANSLTASPIRTESSSVATICRRASGVEASHPWLKQMRTIRAAARQPLRRQTAPRTELSDVCGRHTGHLRRRVARAHDLRASHRRRARDTANALPSLCGQVTRSLSTPVTIERPVSSGCKVFG